MSRYLKKVGSASASKKAAASKTNKDSFASFMEESDSTLSSASEAEKVPLPSTKSAKIRQSIAERVQSNRALLARVSATTQESADKYGRVNAAPTAPKHTADQSDEVARVNQNQARAADDKGTGSTYKNALSGLSQATQDILSQVRGGQKNETSMLLNQLRSTMKETSASINSLDQLNAPNDDNPVDKASLTNLLPSPAYATAAKRQNVVEDDALMDDPSSGWSDVVNHGTAPVKESLASKKAKVLQTLNKRSISNASLHSSSSSIGNALDVAQENKQLKEQLSKLQSSYDDETSILRNNVASKDKRIAELLAKVESLETENAAQSNTISDLKSTSNPDPASVDENMSTLKEELEDQKMELSYLEEKLSSSQRERSELEDANKALQSELEKLKAELEHVKSSRSPSAPPEQMTILQARIADRDDTISLLKRQLESAKRAPPDPSTNNADIFSDPEVIALKETVVSLRKQISQLTSTPDHVIMKTYEEENIKLLDQVKDLKQRLKEFQSTADGEKALLRQEVSLYRTEMLDKQYKENRSSLRESVQEQVDSQKYFSLANDLEHHQVLVTTLEGKVLELNREHETKDQLISSLEARVNELNQRGYGSPRPSRRAQESPKQHVETSPNKKALDQISALKAELENTKRSLAKAQEGERAMKLRSKNMEAELTSRIAAQAPPEPAPAPPSTQTTPQTDMSPVVLERLARLNHTLNQKLVAMQGECKRMALRLSHSEKAIADLNSLGLKRHVQAPVWSKASPAAETEPLKLSLEAKEKVIRGLKGSLEKKTLEAEDLRRQLQLSEATRHLVHENTVTLLRQGQKDVAKVAMWYREQDLKLLREQLLSISTTNAASQPADIHYRSQSVQADRVESTPKATDQTNVDLPKYKSTFDMFIASVETLEREKAALEKELARCQEIISKYEQDARGYGVHAKLTKVYKELSACRSRLAQYERYATPEACRKDREGAMKFFDGQMKRIVRNLHALQQTP